MHNIDIDIDIDLDLVFPGGAGGNWLKGLIESLQCNKDLYANKEVSPGSNFHEHLAHSDVNSGVNLRHAPKINKYIGLSTTGKAWFSIFLNHYYKINVEEMSDFNLLYKARCDAMYVLNYPIISVDIEYNNILNNIGLFTKELFLALDSNGIKYSKNANIIEDSVARYRITTINANEHYSNYDSIPWLGWASIMCGMYHPHIIHTSDDKQEVADALTEFHDAVMQRTKEFI